ncbi:cationic amino acid transporter 1-like [Senna tora]|uniref:Cationic amino acid transporter 1-like n=1 Tax=Senna tora TaxID=362788 RepID=A0A835CJD7_9FABA|nr:cationic amino acid transporter 1-like [Senna tora]
MALSGDTTGGGDGNPTAAAATTTTRKRTCTCSKQDFLPEQSFQSWGNYLHALRSTKSRLQDRLLARSQDHLELHDMRARSRNDMKKTLTWWDLMCFGLGSILGAGIFVLTGDAARNSAGPAVVLSYLISGVAALLSVLCYAEFAVELPVAGGSFAYLRVELGDFVAYIAAGNILFEYIVSGASVARSWTSYFSNLCNHQPNDFRWNVASFSESYRHLDPIAVAVSFAVCVGASLSMKGSSRFNSIATVIHFLVLAFIFVAGMTQVDTSNYSPFVPFGAKGILKASAVLFFAYVGFDGVATLGEETKNPGRDIPIGLIASMLITIIVYCLLAATLCLMQPYTQIDPNAPFTMAFQAVGMNWAKYFTHIARTHMAPPFLAVIHEKTGTPINATIIMTIANSVVAFFTCLDVLANLLSISTLFIFSLVSIGLLVRRYYVAGETSDSDRNKLVGFIVLIVGSSVGSAAYWALSDNGWVGYCVTGPIWVLGTLGLQLTVKEARKAKVWGVPFVPWVPSLSVAMNVFIMGSIDVESFVRFLIWTGLLLIYYLFVALHASYDAAQEIKEVNDDDDDNNNTGEVQV